jgi:hypothetical protein
MQSVAMVLFEIDETTNGAVSFITFCTSAGLTENSDCLRQGCR